MARSREKKTSSPSNAAEPDTRYKMLLGIFKAVREYDKYSPTAPTLIARRFNEDRQIPEERVREDAGDDRVVAGGAAGGGVDSEAAGASAGAV